MDILDLALMKKIAQEEGGSDVPTPSLSSVGNVLTVNDEGKYALLKSWEFELTLNGQSIGSTNRVIRDAYRKHQIFVLKLNSYKYYCQRSYYFSEDGHLTLFFIEQSDVTGSLFVRIHKVVADFNDLSGYPTYTNEQFNINNLTLYRHNVVFLQIDVVGATNDIPISISYVSSARTDRSVSDIMNVLSRNAGMPCSGAYTDSNGNLVTALYIGDINGSPVIVFSNNTHAAVNIRNILLQTTVSTTASSS